MFILQGALDAAGGDDPGGTIKHALGIALAKNAVEGLSIPGNTHVVHEVGNEEEKARLHPAVAPVTTKTTPAEVQQATSLKNFETAQTDVPANSEEKVTPEVLTKHHSEKVIVQAVKTAEIEAGASGGAVFPTTCAMSSTVTATKDHSRWGEVGILSFFLVFFFFFSFML